MEVFLDCIPCALRQGLEVSRIATESIELQEEIMAEAIRFLENYKACKNSPEICMYIHRIVKEKTGIEDPYSEIKKRDIHTAFQLYPKLKEYVNSKREHIHWALKVAATGNVLDSAVNSDIDIKECIKTELQMPFKIYDGQIFEKQLAKARSILIIGDNAGETVFDRILIEELPDIDVIYAVRGAPIINDTTDFEARSSGIHNYARIISSGSEMPGTMLEECEKAFLDIFYSADIVVSKGQGNYETLSDCNRDIYFLLKAKCPVLSRLLGVGINEYVFKYKEG